jgi:cytidylate kinase
MMGTPESGSGFDREEKMDKDSRNASVVAIDGPAASGKSTVARRVAKALGRVYVDSGAVYRAVCWMALCRGVATEDRAAVVKLAQSLKPDFRVVEGAVKFSLDGEDPSEGIRSQAVNDNVSRVAALPEVRALVTGWLREMARFGDLAMEGRDIGTAVFPDARWKFYLDASPEERARRRIAESPHREPVSADAVTQSLRRRDAVDSGRSAAPLRKAGDAVVLDTTGLTVDAVVDAVLAAVRAGVRRTPGA